MARDAVVLEQALRWRKAASSRSGRTTARASRITYASLLGLTLRGRVWLCDANNPHFSVKHFYVGASRATSAAGLGARARLTRRPVLLAVRQLRDKRPLYPQAFAVAAASRTPCSPSKLPLTVAAAPPTKCYLPNVALTAPMLPLRPRQMLPAKDCQAESCARRACFGLSIHVFFARKHWRTEKKGFPAEVCGIICCHDMSASFLFQNEFHFDVWRWGSANG